MKIWSLKSLLFFVGLSIFFTSCTDVGTGTTVDQGPTVSLLSGANLITTDATLNVTEEFTVNVQGAKTDNDMQSLTIQENGTNIDATRTDAVSAVIALSGTEATSFTKVIKIKAQSTVSENIYSFIVADVDGNKTSKSIKITTKGTPPTITLSGSNSISIAKNALLASGFKVEKGTSKLATVEVLVNDVAYDKAKCFYGDQTTVPFAANPLTIPTADQDGFNNKIIIRTPETSGTYKVTYKFTDATGLVSTQIINVTVGTLTSNLTGILLNQAGPTGTGALDLDTGISTGTTAADTDAEIRDMGIDGTLPAATNWKQRIAGANGAEVKSIKKGQNGVPETFSYANITIKEEIAALFNQGTVFTAIDGSLKVSDKIAIGDVFVVKRGDKYYIIETKEVNIVPTTGTDKNSDSYKFDVKF